MYLSLSFSFSSPLSILMWITVPFMCGSRNVARTYAYIWCLGNSPIFNIQYTRHRWVSAEPKGKQGGQNDGERKVVYILRGNAIRFIVLYRIASYRRCVYSTFYKYISWMWLVCFCTYSLFIRIKINFDFTFKQWHNLCVFLHQSAHMFNIFIVNLFAFAFAFAFAYAFAFAIVWVHWHLIYWHV